MHGTLLVSLLLSLGQHQNDIVEIVHILFLKGQSSKIGQSLIDCIVTDLVFRFLKKCFLYFNWVLEVGWRVAQCFDPFLTESGKIETNGLVDRDS